MFDYSHMPDSQKRFLVGEAATQCQHCDNLTLETLNGVTATRYQHWSGQEPKYGRHLRIFGEACILHFKTTATQKLDNRGKRCLFVGNTTNHPCDTYRLWDPVSKRIILSRDVVWVNKMYWRDDSCMSTEEDHRNDISLATIMELQAIDFLDTNGNETIAQDNNSVPSDDSDSDESDEDDSDDELPDLVPRDIELSLHEDDEDLSTGTIEENEANLSYAPETPLPPIVELVETHDSEAEGHVSTLFQDE